MRRSAALINFAKALLSAACAALLGCWAIPAAAQHAPGSNRDALQEITVTARKVFKTDAEMTEQVETALHSDRYIFSEHVSITSKNGVVTLHGMSFFNQDLEGAPPADWVKFREMLQASNAVLFVTPEYNRSVPGVLKNAIDIASRPYGKSAWDGKPCAVVSVSPGAIGAVANPMICP